jgi:hypothetical protein
MIHTKGIHFFDGISVCVCVCVYIYIYIYINDFFFSVLGFELTAYTLSHSTSPFFAKGFFKIGSRKLFAQAGFELWSSWSLLPRITSVRATGAQFWWYFDISVHWAGREDIGSRTWWNSIIIKGIVSHS